jgi:hypothetical protein
LGEGAERWKSGGGGGGEEKAAAVHRFHA